MTSTTDPVSPASRAYRAARDQLLELHGQPDRARAEFRYPDVGPMWNWAVDWFDSFARGNDKPGLIVVEEDGTDAQLSFDEIATRSDQVAAFLAGQGVRRGDSVIVMLGNQVELWDTMLGIIKLGAVVMPTTTAVGPAELRDRIERGAARAVVANAADTDTFGEVPGDYLRVSVGEAPGWVDLRQAYRQSVPPTPHPGTAPDDRLLLYFTSGTTSRPKLVEHTQVSYPVGHLSTMAWLGVRPGDVHLNISSPGWAKHAWSCFFAPWIAEATILVYNYARFDAAALLTVLRSYRVTTFCAPPTVWRMLINADLSGGPGALREVIGAGEPLNPEVIAQVARHWDRTLRDGYGQTETTAQVGNMPGDPVKSGSMGKPLPGVPSVLVDVETGELVHGPGQGELCLDLSAAPLALMSGYQGDEARNAEAMAGGSTTPATSPSGMRRAWSPTSGAPTTSSRPATTRSAPSSWSRCSSSTRRWPRRRSCRRPTRCASRCPRRMSRSPPGTSRPARRRSRSSSTRASTWPRGSGCAGSSSTSCPRPSPARSAGSSCASARRSWRPRPPARAPSGTSRRSTAPPRRSGGTPTSPSCVPAAETPTLRGRGQNGCP